MQHLLRNKITVGAIIFLMMPAMAFSQYREGINLEDHDYKSFHFGINVGLNRSHYSITHHPRFLQFDSVMVIESVNSTGINLAWLVNKRVSDHLDIRTFPLNLTFTEKVFQYGLKYPDKPGGEDTLTTRKVQGITLALPLQLKFSSDRIYNFKAYMMGGGKIEYDLAAQKAGANTEQLMKLKKFDYGFELGMGFHFYFPVFVLTPEIKLGWGLNNVHIRDEDLKYSNVIDKINARTITFSLTVE